MKEPWARRLKRGLKGAFWGKLAVASLVASLFVSPSSLTERDLSLTLIVEKKTLQAGEPLPLELKVRHEGKEPLVLSFPTAQRYDFQIEKEGEVLWRWSEGMMFAQVLGQEVLSKDRPEIRYRAIFDGRLPPGRYQVRGWLTAPGQPSGVAEITVQ